MFDRRNPPAGETVRARRALRRTAEFQAAQRASGWRRWPSPARLAAMRAALVACRGFGPEVAPAYLNAARRAGEWAHDIDWRVATDVQVVVLWARHRHAARAAARAAG